MTECPYDCLYNTTSTFAWVCEASIEFRLFDWPQFRVQDWFTGCLCNCTTVWLLLCGESGLHDCTTQYDTDWQLDCAMEWVLHNSPAQPSSTHGGPAGSPMPAQFCRMHLPHKDWNDDWMLHMCACWKIEVLLFYKNEVPFSDKKRKPLNLITTQQKLNHHLEKWKSAYKGTTF